VNYESQAIDKTTIQVTSSPLTTSKVPGRATIERLSALVGGFDSWCALHRPMGRRDHVVPVLGERWFEVDVTRARGHVDQGEQPDQGQGVPRRGASAQCQRGGRGVGDKGNRHAKVIRTPDRTVVEQVQKYVTLDFRMEVHDELG